MTTPPTAGAGHRRRGSRPLRRAIAAGILGITSLTLVLFALPLAVALGRLDRSQELAELQRDATRTAALIPDNPIPPGHTLLLPPETGATEAALGIYTPDGRRVGGQGPALSPLARAGGDGRVQQGGEAGQLAVAVPVPSDRRTVAVVRAAVPRAELDRRVHRRWAEMTGLGLAVLALAALLARRQARRIAAPLERLTTAARALGDGDFAVAEERSGLREADAASAALRDTAGRLGDLLQRERAFSADASHQLRTPLTGLLLGLESALDRPDADVRGALTDALARGRRLQQTVEDLLALRRDSHPTPSSLDVQGELPAIAERWQPLYAERGRRLTLSVPRALPPAIAAAAALRQVLDVLLDNALQHGAGTVTLLAGDLGDAVTIDISDEGAGISGDPEAVFARRSTEARGHGIGLALARSLAEADGGRLLLRRAAPRPVFTLLLPVADTVLARPSARRPPGQPSSS